MQYTIQSSPSFFEKIQKALRLNVIGQTLNIASMVVILAAIPVTVFFMQEGQQPSQRAQAIIATPTNIPDFCNVCKADLDKNGQVNDRDFDVTRTCVRKPKSQQRVGMCAAADLNNDGQINGPDVNCMTKQFGKLCAENKK